MDKQKISVVFIKETPSFAFNLKESVHDFASNFSSKPEEISVRAYVPV